MSHIIADAKFSQTRPPRGRITCCCGEVVEADNRVVNDAYQRHRRGMGEDRADPHPKRAAGEATYDFAGAGRGFRRTQP